MTTTEPDESQDGCGCSWRGCSGTGVEHCDGCGGDFCVCICGGERECAGCDLCDEDDVLEVGDLEDQLERAIKAGFEEDDRNQAELDAVAARLRRGEEP